ncbi:MAG: hypothetical protein JW891_03240 [Candidatus Lokiarchaeota archaeon]|nr:hypothetical protein [Candidatus Lokiarchaeota archaeon]
MKKNQKSIEVRCPICKKVGWVNISKQIHERSERGLYAAEIPKNSVCEHSFIGYVDENFIFRDCFIADLKLNPPGKKESDKKEQDWLEQIKRETLDLNLIKLNCSIPLLTRLLKAIFNKKKVTLVLKEEFLYDHLSDFLEFITRETFAHDISIIRKGERDPNYDLLDDYIKLEGDIIITDNNGILSEEHLKIERNMVEKFLNEHDLVRSFILIKNEINKAYTYSQGLIEHFKDKKDDPILLKDLKNHFNHIYNTKSKQDYIVFLLNITKNYFKAKIPLILSK